jgi:uncharacterized membrane protein YsdA (DUF1294 family)
MPIWKTAGIIYLAAINIVSFCVCAADKRAARLHRRRVPERTLLILAALFGSAGLYLSMLIFSHKTKKPKFSVLTPLMLVTQTILCSWTFWRLS